jgi:protein SCO1/2
VCGVADRARLLRVAACLCVLLTVTVGVAGCGGESAESPVAQVSTPDDGFNGAALPKPYHVPDVTLTDTEGDRYSVVSDSTTPLTLVFFGYTNCPDVCSVVMADIASALTRLDPAERKQVRMLFVTTDPARDDPATLRRYLDRFDPSFEGLTGPLTRITTLAKPLGVYIQKGQKLPSGGYEVSHGAQVIAMRDDGTAPLVWTGGTSAAQMAEDIPKLLHGAGS